MANKIRSQGRPRKSAAASPRPTFWRYYFGTLLRPRSTFEALMHDARRLKLGLWAMLLTAALYTWIYINLVIGGGAPSTFKPFLAVPAEVYYRYNSMWLLPSMLASWILAGGTAQLLSRLFGGKGAFEDTLSALGFATAIATLASVVHDLPETFLGAIGVIDAAAYEAQMNAPTLAAVVLWIFYGLYGILFVVLYPLAVRATQKIKLGPAVLVGEVALIAYQGLFLVFNR